eukprot:460769-Pyramimonas_sp.AAC.1
MMDLWKAFEQTLHGNLQKARMQHDFPLWLAKLQISLYRLPRVISLESYCSDELVVAQTVLAGDAFATTFMKVMLLTPLDEMKAACPAVVPAVVVDDVVLQRWGGLKRVAKDLAMAAKAVAKGLAK